MGLKKSEQMVTTVLPTWLPALIMPLSPNPLGPSHQIDMPTRSKAISTNRLHTSGGLGSDMHGSIKGSKA